MKRFRVMAAALCAAVLLCGFSVPAYAYADGGEGADYGDPVGQQILVTTNSTLLYLKN